MTLDTLGDQIGNLAAVAPHLGLGHRDQFTPLELHLAIAISERNENFCVEFHFSSNNVLHFFSWVITMLDRFAQMVKLDNGRSPKTVHNPCS